MLRHARVAEGRTEYYLAIVRDTSLQKCERGCTLRPVFSSATKPYSAIAASLLGVEQCSTY